MQRPSLSARPPKTLGRGGPWGSVTKEHMGGTHEGWTYTLLSSTVLALRSTLLNLTSSSDNEETASIGLCSLAGHRPKTPRPPHLHFKPQLSCRCLRDARTRKNFSRPESRVCPWLPRGQGISSGTRAHTFFTRLIAPTQIWGGGRGCALSTQQPCVSRKQRAIF